MLIYSQGSNRQILVGASRSFSWTEGFWESGPHFQHLCIQTMPTALSLKS